MARPGAPREPGRRAGLAPARRSGRGLGTGIRAARGAPGPRGPGGGPRQRPDQRGALRRPAGRGDGGRPRRLASTRPARVGAPARRRSGRDARQRGRLPEVRQGDARRRRGGVPARRARRVHGAGPAPAGPHPHPRRAVRARPAGRPRDRRGAPARAVAVRPGGTQRGPAPAAAVRGRDRPALRQRPAGGGLEAPRRRARDHRLAGLRPLLPDRRRRHRPDRPDGGALRGARVGSGQPGQPPPRHLRRRPDPARPADGAVPLAAALLPARHRPRRRVGPARGRLPRDPRPLRRRAGRLRVDDRHLSGATRGARRRSRAGDAAGRGRRHRQGVPPRPRPRRPPGAPRPARAAGQWVGGGGARPVLRSGRAPRRTAPARRGAPLRRAAVRRDAAGPHPCRGVVGRIPHEPVRQGRRGGPRTAQARRAGHPDAVGHGARRRRGRAGRRGQDRPRRRDAGALRRRRDLRADQHRADAGRLPDRVTGPARAGGQVRHRLLRRHRHRHLAVPARSGAGRHGHPLPRGQAGVDDRAAPPRRPAPDPRADPRGGRLPRAGHRDHRAPRRCLPRGG